MLPIQFDEIGSEHIVALVETGSPERKTLEYKAKLNIATGDDRAEFLADISSFSNAAGGDIIFGIADRRDASGNATGIPEAIAPLTIANPDSELGKLSQIIESGIQPRLVGVQAKVIDIPSRGPVIVVRVPKSWNAPHMVSFANRSRFYSRNEITGKIQLDVQQIGSAFAAQRSVGERIRAWRTDRIGKSVAEEGPVPIKGPRLLFHFVSIAALDDEQTLPRVFDRDALRPFNQLMSLSPNAYRYNADGLLYESRDTESGQSYLQIFRDGHLEYGDSYTLGGHDEAVASQRFEEKLRDSFKNALGLLQKIESREPIFVSLTLINVKGRSMWLPRDFAFRFDSMKSHPFDRPIIISPDVLLQDVPEGFPYPTTLLPVVNSIWQAAGLEETPYKDHWIAERS